MTENDFFDWFDDLTPARRLELRARLIGYIEVTCDDDWETIRRTPDGMTPEEWMRELAEEDSAKLKRIKAELKEVINEAN